MCKIVIALFCNVNDAEIVSLAGHVECQPDIALPSETLKTDGYHVVNIAAEARRTQRPTVQSLDRSILKVHLIVVSGLYAGHRTECCSTNCSSSVLQVCQRTYMHA